MNVWTDADADTYFSKAKWRDLDSSGSGGGSRGYFPLYGTHTHFVDLVPFDKKEIWLVNFFVAACLFFQKGKFNILMEVFR